MISLLKFFRFLGPTLLFFGTFVVLPPMVLSYFNNALDSQLVNIYLVCIAYSLVVFFTLRQKKFTYSPKDGFVITFLTWVIISLLASIPFLNANLVFFDALFEAVSGLTTTGSTVIKDLYQLPDHILLYRQLLQWAGGVGLVIVVLAIIPAVSGGMKVLQAETSGFADKSFSPRLRDTARSLLKFYFLITIACVLSYWSAGMTWFEAFSHSFSTVSIGGFSIYNENFGYFDNPTIEFVAVFFMLMSATNFGLHFLSFTKRSFKYYLTNDELKFFLGIIFTVVLISTLTLYIKEGFSINDSIRYGFFQSISIVTTTGYTLEPLSELGGTVGFIIFILAFIGACSGSVGGGMKVWRILLMLKVGFSNITKIMHPSAVSSVKLNGEKVVSSQIEAVFSFIAIYISFFLLFMFVLIFQNVDFYSAFSGTAAAINNLGPGLGGLSENYSTLSDTGKFALTLAMIVGRLELFGVLILFVPSFWRS
jgi:trk system potassium uptake protein TrkH